MSKKVTLGLAMICGSGESEELARCLKSVRRDLDGEPNLLDEIVVGVNYPAGKDIDQEVLAVANKYATKVITFEWENDFGGARNKTFKEITCSHTLWLDSDDIVKPENYKKLLELKPFLVNYDIVLMPYIYSHNKNDTAVITLPRERIVRNTPDIRWEDPIHECLNLSQLDPKKPPFRIKEENIPVDHYRHKMYDPVRNLTILEKEYGKPTCSPRIKFYYGRDLAESGYWDKATPILTDLINSGDGYRDNLAIACVKMAGHYLEKGNLDQVKFYSFKGIGFSEKYAEFYLYLGDIFKKEGDEETAVKYYQEALTKKLDGGMSQMPDYYKYFPADRLSVIYYGRRDLEKALYYNTLTLECYPQDDRVIRNRETMLKEMTALDVLLPNDTVKELENFITSKGFDFQLVHNFANSADIKILKSEVVPLEICWLIPYVDVNNPSTRIRRINVNKKLNDLGTKSVIIDNYYPASIDKTLERVGKSNVIVFTQFSEYDLELMKRLRVLGKRVVLDFNEAILGSPFVSDCMNASDIIVCCSKKLEELTIEHGHTNTAIIKDAVEDVTVPAMNYVSREKPVAVWCGMGGNSFLATEVLKEAIQKAGYSLLVLSEWDYPSGSWFDHKKWGIDTWVKDMMDCDVVLCPQREEVQPGKSNVKVTQAMALGIPVIASKMLSYTEIVEHGKNGYLASIRSPEEWREALVELKDVSKRRTLGTNGLNSISKYRLESVANEWVNLSKNLFRSSQKERSQPPVSPQKKLMKQVDLIIANYNNVEYLKLLISSIKLNTTHPYNIIISDAGSNEETWEYLDTLKGFKILGKRGARLNFSEAVNAGINASNTELFVVMNSDLIVSKNWLTSMVEKMETVDRLAACGVLSNCDSGWLINAPGKPQFNMTLEKSGLVLRPGMKMEEITPNLEDLYSFMEKSNVLNKGKYQPQKWVAAYCTIYARSAVNEIGLFDPTYRNGCEDLDHLLRIEKAYYSIGQALDSFVFHFGGISRGAYQKEDRESYNKEDHRNHETFANKWYTDSSRQTPKKKIAIYTGAAHEPWNRETVDNGMAGSETWAAELAAEFSRRGCSVQIFNQCITDGEVDRDGVVYRDYRKLHEAVAYDYLDVFISSRTCEPLAWSLHSKAIFVMIHDIFISANPNYDLRDWRVSKYAYLSNWHKDFLLQHHKGMSPNKMMLTMNGINQDLYTGTYEKKNQMVYSSSADRGLRELLLMLPEIRKAVPDFKVLIFYGFLNWESAAKARNNPAEMQEIETIKKLMEQPGVEYRGRVDKNTLAKNQMESKVWLFPTFFSETFCNTAVENSLAKNAILSSNLAGLKTTVSDSGILLDGYADYGGSHPETYKRQFIEESIKLLTDESYRLSWAEKAYQKAQQYTWKNCADGWAKEFGW